MHSGVFIGSCDVIGMEFPKGEVGLFLSDVFTLVILTSVKMVCVCVCCVMVKEGK